MFVQFVRTQGNAFRSAKFEWFKRRLVKAKDNKESHVRNLKMMIPESLIQASGPRNFLIQVKFTELEVATVKERKNIEEHDKDEEFISFFVGRSVHEESGEFTLKFHQTYSKPSSGNSTLNEDLQELLLNTKPKN